MRRSTARPCLRKAASSPSCCGAAGARRRPVRCAGGGHDVGHRDPVHGPDAADDPKLLRRLTPQRALTADDAEDVDAADGLRGQVLIIAGCFAEVVAQPLLVAVILWTCRTDEHLDDAMAWCYEQGIHINKANANLSDWQEAYHKQFPDVNPDGRKVAADIYLDDKANFSPINWDKAYEWLRKVGYK